jgi:hypothetical protein
MKILIHANCLTDSLGPALQSILELDSETHDVRYQRFHKGLAANEGYLEALQRFDFVVTNVGEVAELLRPTETQVIRIPDLYFHGFQPDITYFEVNDGWLNCKRKPTFATPYSLLVTWSYLRGLTAVKTATLFNREVFDELGYFHAFSDSCIALRQRFDDTNMSSELIFSELGQPSRGMHDVVHPTLRVALSIVPQIISLLGLQMPVDRSELIARGVRDALADEVIWPVYPEIAEELGFRGSYVFSIYGTVIRNLNEFLIWHYAELQSQSVQVGSFCHISRSHTNLYTSLEQLDKKLSPFL